MNQFFKNGFRLETESLNAIKNPRSQGVSRFQSGEELANSVGK